MNVLLAKLDQESTGVIEASHLLTVVLVPVRSTLSAVFVQSGAVEKSHVTVVPLPFVYPVKSFGVGAY